MKQENEEIHHLFSSLPCNDLGLTFTLLFVHCRSSDNHTSLVSKMVEHMLDPARYNKKIRPGADKGQSHEIITIPSNITVVFFRSTLSELEALMLALSRK